VSSEPNTRAVTPESVWPDELAPARDSLTRDGLDEFDAAQKPMQVFKYQNRRAGTVGDLRHRPNHSQRVL
jgi:hypothetical protein